MITRVFRAALALALIGTAATAQTVLDGRTAKAQLFAPKGVTVAVAQSLSAQDQATVRALVPVMQQRMAIVTGYYGAIAFSPSEGLVSESLQGALNYHSIPAAEAAALSACESAKASGSSRCIVAGRVLPRRYAERGFTLSMPATGGFAQYDRARGGKAFAISPTAGGWGWGASDAAALQACAAEGARDCRVVIRN